MEVWEYCSSMATAAYQILVEASSLDQIHNKITQCRNDTSHYDLPPWQAGSRLQWSLAGRVHIEKVEPVPDLERRQRFQLKSEIGFGKEILIMYEQLGDSADVNGLDPVSADGGPKPSRGLLRAGHSGSINLRPQPMQ